MAGEKSLSVKKDEESQPALSPESSTESRLEAVFAQMEERLPQQLSDKHIDRYFETKQKLYKHVRDDHKDQKELVKNGRKYLLFYIVAFGTIFILLIGILALANKDSLNKFLELFFAFLGGTGVGSIGGGVITRQYFKSEE